MKKISQIILIVLLVFLTASCTQVKTYNELETEFENYLEKSKPNYIDLITNFNNLTEDVFSSIVRIDLAFRHGTGVIFQADENYYYILTNAHVVYTNEETNNHKVYDTNDCSYDFEIIDYSLDHDLAIIKIAKTKELTLATFSKLNSTKNNEVIIIGYHGEQKNAVSYGSVILFDTVDLKNNEDVKVLFPVMISNNPIKSGSSGSIVVNSEGELVGILYAGSFENNQTTAKYAFSIPVEIIISYLEENGFDPIFRGDN